MQSDESAIPQSDPFMLFEVWYAEAKESEPNDPNAMALATASEDGLPSVRMVLLKGHGPDGFVFYTNAESRKGEQIRANMRAALLFHWKSLRRQIRIEGRSRRLFPFAAARLPDRLGCQRPVARAARPAGLSRPGNGARGTLSRR